MTAQEPKAVDHTPVTAVQEIQQALVSAGLDIRSVFVNVSLTDRPGASILSGAHYLQYDAHESDRLAQYLIPDAVYDEHGKPGERIATLQGTTRTGIAVTIHCQPRMAAEEVAAEIEAGAAS